MNGPIPTIAFMFSATHSVRPRPRSSFSDGRGMDMGVAKRPKHIRCMGGAKASRQDGDGSVSEKTSRDLADLGCNGSRVMWEFLSKFLTQGRANPVRGQLPSGRPSARNLPYARDISL